MLNSIWSLTGKFSCPKMLLSVVFRGTRFGLETPMANIESVLCSLPLNAGWQYKHSPAPGSREEKLTEVLKNPKEWV